VLAVGEEILQPASFFLDSFSAAHLNLSCLGITRTKVYFAEISSLSLSQGYISRLIHSCAVYIDTDAIRFDRNDMSQPPARTPPAIRIYSGTSASTGTFAISGIQSAEYLFFRLSSYYPICFVKYRQHDYHA